VAFQHNLDYFSANTDQPPLAFAIGYVLRDIPCVSRIKGWTDSS